MMRLYMFTLIIRTDGSDQAVKTLREEPDQGLHCLLFCQYILHSSSGNLIELFKFLEYIVGG